jgi:hypothetical protein
MNIQGVNGKESGVAKYNKEQTEKTNEMLAKNKVLMKELGAQYENVNKGIRDLGVYRAFESVNEAEMARARQVGTKLDTYS